MYRYGVHENKVLRIADNVTGDGAIVLFWTVLAMAA